MFIKLETKFAYFAGFFDKSGSILFRKRGRSGYLRVTITHKDEAPLKIGQEIWGGSLIKTTDGFMWVISAEMAKKFLSDVKFWSISKKEKIEYFLNQSFLSCS